MQKSIEPLNYETNDYDSVVFSPVKKCPLCHATFNGEVMESAIAPYEYSSHSGEKRRFCLYVLHYCQVCGRGFCGIYAPATNSYNAVYESITAVPKKNDPVQFPPEISELSPSFVSIYEEADSAEKNGLTLICGMGYRKALEFLVKDYLISNFPQDEETISAEPLAKSISRIDNPKIKTLAERSAWLGNDETHYIKKHEGYSFKDIKSFLDAIVAFISYEKTVEKALEIPRR